MKKRHNVHGKGTQTASRKKELALALCVSLWMAGGSVASAEPLDTLNEDHVGNVYGNNNGTDWDSYTADPINNTVTVENAKVTGKVAGSYFKTEGVAVKYNTVILNGAIVTNEVHGGSTTKNVEVSYNTVILDGATVTNKVYGGYSDSTSAPVMNNTVIMRNNATANYVYGGGNSFGATGKNTIIMEGATLIILFTAALMKTRTAR